MKDRRLTVGYIYAGNKKIPALRLAGDWLLAAGFDFDHKVVIKHLPEGLLIQNETEEKSCG